MTDQPQNNKNFNTGDRVEANVLADGRWYPAILVKRDRSRWWIRFDNPAFNVDYSYRSQDLRAPAPAPADAPAPAADAAAAAADAPAPAALLLLLS